jgi:CRP-like cAMP-binding protein
LPGGGAGRAHGDKGASLFVVVERLLGVLRPSVEGDESQVDEMTPGDAFGDSRC